LKLHSMYLVVILPPGLDTGDEIRVTNTGDEIRVTDVFPRTYGAA